MFLLDASYIGHWAVLESELLFVKGTNAHTHGKCDKSEKGGGCWLEQLLKVAAQNFERKRDCASLFVLLH